MSSMGSIQAKLRTKHTMLVTTELTTEDMLELFIDLAQKLTHQRDKAREESKSWEHQFHMYREAWLREMGGKLLWKSHEIDALVKTTAYHYERSQLWGAYENSKINPDPFWMVPDPDPCTHQRCNEDGICRKCGLDCRGAH